MNTQSRAKYQAAFFFGSGISIPSHMPSVSQITDAAHIEDWHIHTDGSFLPGLNPNSAIPDKVTPVVKAFLTKINDCAIDYLRDLPGSAARRKPNYEDLFSLAEQASRSETDFVPNLATVEFSRRLRRDTASLHNGFMADVTGSNGFIRLAESACNFLHSVVHHKLLAGGKEVQGLELISETASAVAALDIFTLNHDLLIERQLATGSTSEIECGFEDRNHGEFCVYRPGWWASQVPRKKVRLFKLHGSLNWWLYDFPDWALQYAIPDGYPDPYHSKDEKSQFVNPRDSNAAFLSGTVVKEMRYGAALWSELFSGFRSHLAGHTYLICCGYGFQDTGVNQQLVQWMHNQLDGRNRLVILTPDNPEAFLPDKPYWLNRLHQAGRLIFVPKYLEKCTLADLRPYFDTI